MTQRTFSFAASQPLAWCWEQWATADVLAALSPPVEMEERGSGKRAR